MRLRAVVADRLALALLDAQQVDDAGPNRKTKSSAVIDRAAGAEGDVAEDVEDRDLSPKLTSQ